MIPYIVHNIWIQGYNNLPKNEYNNLQMLKKLNPNYKFMFWDNVRIKQLLQELPEVLKVYNELEERKENTFPWRSDIARYVILWKYGGIYSDLDIECIGTFDKIFTDNDKSDIYIASSEVTFLTKMSLNLFKTPKYGSYFMGFSKNHPVWKKIFKRIVNAKSKRDIGFAIDNELQESKYKVVVIKQIQGHYNCSKNKDTICVIPVESSWNMFRPILKKINCMNYKYIIIFLIIFLTIVILLLTINYPSFTKYIKKKKLIKYFIKYK